ncbi:MAG: hypothetical protein AAGI38_12320 [Bacteroidota bacterium]
MKQLLFIGFMFPLCASLYSQQWKVGLEATTGAEIGWWIYDKGSNLEGVSNNLGWDRTHLAMMGPYEVTLLVQRERIGVGLVGGIRYLADDEMIASEHTSQIRNKYPITENEESLWMNHTGIQFSYGLIHSPRFTLAPEIRLGFFDLETIHPGKDRFGVKSFWQLSVVHSIKLTPAVEAIVRPTYFQYHISVPDPVNFNERHDIYGIGVNAGIRFWLFQSSARP